MTRKLTAHWFAAFALLHLPFWFVYHFIWYAIFMNSFSFVVNEVFYSPRFIKFLGYPIFHASAACIILYYLVPKYLERGRHVAFLWSLSAVIIMASVFIVFGYYLNAWISEKTFDELFGESPSFINLFQTHAIFSTIASMTLAMSLKFSQNWLRSQRREQLAAHEKVETELNYLRSQLNPHFIFNTINSIFFLIKKNPDKASSSLARFSRMLRYQLYECNDSFIALSKEIIYIENFISLEKLRQNENVSIHFDKDEHFSHEGKVIAPFILTTFIENAFKHVSKENHKPSWINIILTGHDTNLELTVSNSVAAIRGKDVVDYGGIGLKNVKRRLDLLYPGCHELTIHQNDESFHVRLKIKLARLITQADLQQKQDAPIMILNEL